MPYVFSTTGTKFLLSRKLATYHSLLAVFTTPAYENYENMDIMSNMENYENMDIIENFEKHWNHEKRGNFEQHGNL